MDRKKELKQQYKQMKHPMGVFIVRSKSNNKCLLEATNNLRARFNRILLQLSANMHPNQELQKEWNELGKENFTFEILEELEYDKDESKTDYSEDLDLLYMIWEEKLTAQGVEFFRKKI
ncbi:MAG: GIY-YIG nuclease family protein [Peptococcaceae bacterium]|nr:GIY-YIG nuclease family protein [Peptococcaceae bacterium]